MAVVSITEHWKDRRVIETLDGGNTGTRSFQVIVDDPATSEAEILANDALPKLGSVFPGSDTAKCNQRSVTRESNQRIEFWVTCDYKSTLSQDEDETAQNPNPLDRRAKITWKGQRVMVPRRRLMLSDYYSLFVPTINESFAYKQAANSASDPFEPVLEYPEFWWTAVITKNVPAIPQWFLEYENAVNHADVVLDFYGTPRTIKKGCGLLGSISMPRAKTENGVEYVQLSFEIITRQPRELREGEDVAPEPWDEEIPDTGMRVKNIVDAEGGGIDTIWSNVLDTNGIAVNLPIPFNGSGRPINISGSSIPETEIKYRLARPYPRKNFSILPLT